MKLSNKTFIVLILTMFFIGAMTNVIFAQEFPSVENGVLEDNTESIVSVTRYKEIKDDQKIMDMASEYKSDLYDVENIGVNTYNQEVTTTLGDTIEYEVTEYKTAQLLEEKTLSSGKTSNVYAINLVASYDGSRTDSLLDPSLGVRAYSTIYIERIYHQNTSYVKLLRSSGGWTRLDSSLNITGQYTIQGSVGMGVEDLFLFDQTKNHQINFPTYDINAPSSWKHVNTSGVSVWTSHVGETNHVDIFQSNPNNSWHLYLNNEY